MLQSFFVPFVILLCIAAFVFAFVAPMVAAYKVQRDAKRYDFHWYQQEFPDLVKDDRVACYQCRSKHLGVERKMNHSYVRSHYCRSCGTTLYYSKEH